MSLWEQFKSEYPKAVNNAAFNAWRELFPEEMKEVLDGLSRWKQSEQWKDARFIPNAENFLKREKWKETPPDYVQPFRPNEPPRRLTQDELFSKRHITTADSYRYYQRAQIIDNWTKDRGLKF